MAKTRKEMAVTRRRRQLGTQLITGLLEKKDRSGKSLPGLLKKALDKIEKDMDDIDPEIRGKAIDKVIKLLPFAIAKEKAPAVQVNVQNNTLDGGKAMGEAIMSAKKYLQNRSNQMENRNGKFKKNQKRLESTSDVEFEEVDEKEIIPTKITKNESAPVDLLSNVRDIELDVEEDEE